MQSRFAAAMLALSLIAAPAAVAATKMDEGFASTYELKGRFFRPTNTISQGVMGQPVMYWIQWKDYPTGVSSFRCVVTYEADSDPVYDETFSYADSHAEGWSYCGVVTDHDVHPDGTYHFVQYLNDKQVGESSILVKTRFIDRILHTHWSIWLLLILAGAGLLRLISSRKEE